MSQVGRWGTVLVPQVILGGLAYYLVDINALSFAFAVAGVVATVFMVIAMRSSRKGDLAITISLLAFTLAALCFIAGAILFAGAAALISFAAAPLASHK